MVNNPKKFRKDLLKNLWRSSFNFYEGYLIGKDIDLDVCSYNSLSDDSYFAKDVKYESEVNYKRMYSLYLQMSNKIAILCSMHMDIIKLNDPSSYF